MSGGGFCSKQRKLSHSDFSNTKSWLQNHTVKLLEGLGDVFLKDEQILW